MSTTDRLTLRAPCLNDTAVVTRIMQDIEIARWPTNPPFPTGSLMRKGS